VRLPGLGVYHGPIKELAEQYLPGQVVDLTGADFSAVEYALSQGKPVWTITSAGFSPVLDYQWRDVANQLWRISHHLP